jgi:uncharacterized HAD superfamily protein
MKSILVFLDGTVCDMRHRIPLIGKDEFFADDNVLKDVATIGSIEFMKELAEMHHLFYIGARPEIFADITKEYYSAKSELYGEIIGDLSEKDIFL